MAMDVDAALVRAFAPPHLADAIIGDLCERRAALAQTLGGDKASVICRADTLRSLPALAAHCAWEALADNWTVALAAAAVICVLCVAAIPLWDQWGFGGAGYHVLRLALIGLILGCIPRASTLSCALLLVMIGIADCAIDAPGAGGVWRVLSGAHLYAVLLLDGAAMASMLVALRILRFVRALRYG